MMFNVAASAYDAFMGRFSRLLSPQMADLAGVIAGQRVLDVGCGPGALTSELVDRVGAANVSAIDPSAPFVEAARTRFPGVTVVEGPAEALPFPDHAFDAAIAQLVVHFMREPVAGIREMARATRTGGAIAACVWDHGGGSGPLSPFWTAARELDPGVTDEADLPGSRHGELEQLFEAAGLTDVQGSSLIADLSLPDFDTWWAPFEQGVGPAGMHVARLDPAARAALRDQCRRNLGDRDFVIKARAWAARGTVPAG